MCPVNNMAKNKENKSKKIKTKKNKSKNNSMFSPFPPLIISDKKSLKVFKKIMKTPIGDETKVDAFEAIRRCNELM